MSQAEEQHAQTQMQITTMAALIAPMGDELAEFIHRIEHAHAVGPILDPTLYRAGMRKMDAIGELARAALAFSRASQKFQETITALDQKGCD